MSGFLKAGGGLRVVCKNLSEKRHGTSNLIVLLTMMLETAHKHQGAVLTIPIITFSKANSDMR